MLFDKRSKLKDKLKSSGEDNDVLEDLIDVEKEITNEVAKDNRDKVMDSFKTLADTNGTININGIWSLKKKVFPKNTKPLPCAKKNVEGRIITSQTELKQLYMDTFIHRLRHRPIKEDLTELQNLKEELCELRLKFSKLNKSKLWEKKDLMKILSSLKNNKSRDPHGLVNELLNL